MNDWLLVAVAHDLVVVVAAVEVAVVVVVAVCAKYLRRGCGLRRGRELPQDVTESFLAIMNQFERSDGNCAEKKNNQIFKLGCGCGTAVEVMLQEVMGLNPTGAGLCLFLYTPKQVQHR